VCIYVYVYCCNKTVDEVVDGVIVVSACYDQTLKVCVCVDIFMSIYIYICYFIYSYVNTYVYGCNKILDEVVC
jgi:hypothetical protein